MGWMGGFRLKIEIEEKPTSTQKGVLESTIIRETTLDVATTQMQGGRVVKIS